VAGFTVNCLCSGRLSEPLNQVQQLLMLSVARGNLPDREEITYNQITLPLYLVRSLRKTVIQYSSIIIQLLTRNNSLRG